MSEPTTETKIQGNHYTPEAPPLARITMTPTIGKLLAALAVAQGEFTAIPKNRNVKVQLKAGGSYDFDYATLDAVLAATRPALSRNGIAFVQVVTGGGEASWQITTMLACGEERIESVVQLPGGFEGPQELGSYITYLRRYTAVSLLGVVADEDDDGNGAAGNQSTRTERQPAQKPAANGGQDPKGGKPSPTSSPRSASSPTTTQGSPNGSPAASSAPPAAPADPEHAETLKKVRNCVGNELKWEDKRARAFISDLFGVTPPVPASLSKAQAAVALQLLIEAADSEEAFKAALAKARAASPELFAPQKGAAA